jgi:hypothetical protein
LFERVQPLGQWLQIGGRILFKARNAVVKSLERVGFGVMPGEPGKDRSQRRLEETGVLPGPGSAYTQ